MRWSRTLWFCGRLGRNNPLDLRPPPRCYHPWCPVFRIDYCSVCIRLDDLGVFRGLVVFKSPASRYGWCDSGVCADNCVSLLVIAERSSRSVADDRPCIFGNATCAYKPAASNGPDGKREGMGTYVDLPFVVVAAGILVSHARWRLSWQIPAVALGTVVVVGFVLASSIRTYKLWLSDNLKTLAITRAVAAADKNLTDDTLLVFDEPEYAPLVEARLGRPLHALLNYTDVFKSPIPSTPGFSPTLLADALFEYSKQTAVTPAAAMEILQQEARQRAGFYSGFIFNVCEYWYPCTDGRAVKTEKIVATLPSVVMSYTNFLAKPAPPGKFAFVTSKSLPAPSKGEIISEGRATSIVARVSLRN